jgi:hypothetical protein
LHGERQAVKRLDFGFRWVQKRTPLILSVQLSYAFTEAADASAFQLHHSLLFLNATQSCRMIDAAFEGSSCKPGRATMKAADVYMFRISTCLGKFPVPWLHPSRLITNLEQQDSTASATELLRSPGIMAAGAVMEGFAYHFNLRQLSNASAMWMGMNPPDIFLYIFLPPLLLDSASRIEFFMFRKVLASFYDADLVAFRATTLAFDPPLYVTPTASE